MNAMLRSLSAAALGATAMYLLDPDVGRRRRALMRDQLASGAHDFQDFLGVAQRDLGNRLQGVASRFKVRRFESDAEDGVLVERVRSQLGRAVSHPRAVHVSAAHGSITLEGAILEREREALLQAVRGTHGVREVVDRVQGFDEAENIPALQGGRDRAQLAEWRQMNWSPAMRLTSGSLGSWMLASGLRRGGLSGTSIGTAGLALLVRSITNMPLRDLGTLAHRGIDVQKTIEINAPVDLVYDLLCHYENFPLFMRNVRHIEIGADGISHWTVAGPAGVPVQWDAETTQREPNRLLAWRTLPGSKVEHEGVVRFEEAERGTRLSVRMSYRPPAGALGHVVARLFGADPKTEFDEDLLRLKTLLETGKPPRDAAQRPGEPRAAS